MVTLRTWCPSMYTIRTIHGHHARAVCHRPLPTSPAASMAAACASASSFVMPLRVRRLLAASRASWHGRAEHAVRSPPPEGLATPRLPQYRQV
jgi:hypothetical protein